MFQETPDVSAELEWMLQNRQVSPKRLAETLIQREYTRILRLACSLLVDFPQAQRAAIDTFASVLLNTRPYWGETSLTVWFDRLAVEASHKADRGSPKTSPRPSDPSGDPQLHGDRIWQAIGSLPDRLRFPLVLTSVHGLDIGETSVLLGTTPEDIQVLLYSAREELTQRLESAGLAFPLDEPLEAARLLAGAQERLCPTPALHPAAVEGLARQVLERVHQRRDRQRRSRFRREIFWIGSALVLLLGFLWMESRSLPVQSQPPQLATPVPTGARLADVIPEEAAERRGNPVEPLNEYASPEAVRQRILESQDLYRTLWMDARVIDYGPANYIGPPQRYRNQLWVHRPDDNVLLAVGRPIRPEVVLSLQHDAAIRTHFGADLRTGQVFQGQSRSLPPIFELLPLVNLSDEPYRSGRLLDGFYLTDLVLPPVGRLRSGSMDVLGMEMAAGRKAVVVDWIPGPVEGTPGLPQGGVPVTGASNRIRLWVDAHTGVILRWRIFDGPQPLIALMDVTVTAMVTDARFPEGLFGPHQNWSTDLMWDDLWHPQVEDSPRAGSIWADPPERRILPYTPPPPAFDPALNQLTFQQITDPETGMFDRTEVDLFAGGYYLNKIDMGNPFNMLCERSPNGQTIAWVPSPGRYTRQETSLLRWIGLDRPRSIHVQVGAGEDFAFSPDSRYLVFHSCLITGCGVDLLDLETGETLRLLALDHAGLFTWSPDGTYLALAGSLPNPTEPWKLFIFRMPGPGRTFSKITYTHPIDPENPVLPEDAPLHDWGVAFPPTPTGLDGCR